MSAIPKLFPATLDGNAVAAAAADDNVADVPGCNCAASVCPGVAGGSSKSTAVKACDFLQQLNRDFSESVDGGKPVCDALLDLDDFQDSYGDGATTRYYQSDGGPTKGPYYEAGALPVYIFAATCDDVIKDQLSCAPSIGSITGFVYYSSDPSGCLYGAGMLPVTNTTLRFGVSCASQYDDSIVSGSDDRLGLFVETGYDGGVSLCDGAFTPVRDSGDWIEPAEGRRYMCYDFADPNDASAAYSALVMSLGNEHCRGPEPEPAPAPPEPNSAGSVHVLGGFGLLMALPFVLLRW